MTSALFNNTSASFLMYFPSMLVLAFISWSWSLRWAIISFRCCNVIKKISYHHFTSMGQRKVQVLIPHLWHRECRIFLSSFYYICCFKHRWPKLEILSSSLMCTVWDIRICMVKNDCFCSLRIWKDLDKKFKLCDGHISSLGHLCF